MNRRPWLSGVVLCLCALACCSCAIVPVSSGRFIEAPEGSAVRWAVPFNGSDSKPALVDSLLFIGSADGGVYCFNARSGAQQWRFQTGEGLRSGPRIIEAESDDLQDMLAAIRENDGGKNPPEREVEATPVVRDGTVYVGSMDQGFYAIDAETGEVRWSTPLGLYLSSRAVVSGGAVVVTGYRRGVRRPGNSVLFVLDANDGSIKWATDVGGAVSAPAVRDGVVYCALLRDEDFSFVAFELDTGTRIWSSDCEGVEVGGLVVTADLVMVHTHLEVKPEIEPEKELLLPPYVTGVYALERDSGEVRWFYRAPEGGDSSKRVSPSPRHMPADDSRVYMASRKGVYALDIETGEAVWRHDGEFSPLSLYLGDHVYVCRGWALRKEETIAIARESGRVVWQTSSPRNLSIWTVLGGRVYGVIYNSMLFGIDPADGSVAWRFRNNGALLHSDPVEFEGGIIFATGTELIWGGGGAQGYLFSILPAMRPE